MCTLITRQSTFLVWTSVYISCLFWGRITCQLLAIVICINTSSFCFVFFFPISLHTWCKGIFGKYANFALSPQKPSKYFMTQSSAVAFLTSFPVCFCKSSKCKLSPAAKTVSENVATILWPVCHNATIFKAIWLSRLESGTSLLHCVKGSGTPKPLLMCWDEVDWRQHSQRTSSLSFLQRAIRRWNKEMKIRRWKC